MSIDADTPGSSRKSEAEQFQPLPVLAPNASRWRFVVRCLVDLQLGSIVRALRQPLSEARGTVLDVGAGESPWKDFLAADATYLGIDVKHSGSFGMSAERDDIVYFDGINIPYPDASVDHVMCVEVLEHCVEPIKLLEEMTRVLKPGGQLLLTVPWSARRHHIPHDYHRFSRDALTRMLEVQAYRSFSISERGTDVAAIANKLLVLSVRLWRPSRRLSMVWTLPLALLVTPLAGVFILASHCADALGAGSRLDPLGYFVRAIKSDAYGQC